MWYAKFSVFFIEGVYIMMLWIKMRVVFCEETGFLNMDSEWMQMQWGLQDRWTGAPHIHAWTFLHFFDFDTRTHERGTHTYPSQLPAVVDQTVRGQPEWVRQSSQSAGWSVVQTVTLAAGSSVSAGLSWQGDIWPRSISGSDRLSERNPVLTASPIFQARFMSWSLTNALFPHAGSLRHVYCCLARRAEQSAQLCHPRP